MRGGVRLRLVLVLFSAVLFCALCFAAEEPHIHFLIPETWVEAPPPPNGFRSYFTSGNPSEALMVMIRVIDVPDQSALQWANDEADHLKSEGMKILVPPVETDIGQRTWVKLETRVLVQGPGGLLGTSRSEQYFTKEGKTSLVEVNVMGREANFNDTNRKQIIDLLSSLDTGAQPEGASLAEELARRGLDYFDRGEFDNAIAELEAALKESPTDRLKAAIFATLSSAYLQKGVKPFAESKDDTFYKESLANARKALEISPTNWIALANIGTVYMNMGDLEKADYYHGEARRYIDEKDPNYQRLAAQHELILKALAAKKKQ